MCMCIINHVRFNNNPYFSPCLNCEGFFYSIK